MSVNHEPALADRDPADGAVAPPPGGATPRVAVRVVLIDRNGRTLLFRGGDPHRPEDGTWWFTPGGGVEGDETLPETARREVREETGVDVVEFGDPVHRRQTRFDFEGTSYDQVEHYFVARVDLLEPDVSGWTDVERRVVLEHRWWTLDDVRSTRETIYPEQLAEILADALTALSA
jgi:ADP-ribose pyrophosphatase YjhB (NUDIX family)